MNTDRLAELIGQKHQVLEQIRELARRQAEVIPTGDMAPLMTVLSAKQTLLDQLQEIESHLNPFRHQDPEARIWPSAEARSRCRQVAERCEALLSEILILEKQGEAEMTARRDEAARRLQAIHSGAEATAGYSQTSPRRAQLDLTSDT